MRLWHMVRAVALFAGTLGLFVAWAAGPAAAQQKSGMQPGGLRVALVVGNSNYQSVGRLANPGNDAVLVAASLKASGFKLIGGGAQLNLDKTAFDHAVADFGRTIVGADVAMFYYSGHGLQVDGTNFLVPVDANPSRRQDLDFQMVSAELVLRQMSGSGTKLNILILDACRNNPFEGRGMRSTVGGLAEMKAPEGTLISYATQPGAVASDGEGKDSPFTTALVDAIRQPGLDIFRLFNHVGLEVKRVTAGAQQPWLSASPIEGEFTFGGPALPVPAPPPLAVLVPETGVADSKSTVASLGHATGLSHGAPDAPGGPAPAPTPAAIVIVPPLVAPEHAAGEFACPSKDWFVFGEDEVFDWAGDTVSVRRVDGGWSWHALGSDPDKPHSCLRSGKTGPLHRLAGWFDIDANDFATDPERPMLALLQGQARDMSVRYTPRKAPASGAAPSFETRWHLRGHDSFPIAGHAYDTLVFDLSETSNHSNGTAMGRVWYAPALGIFVRKVWRDSSASDAIGFSIVDVSANGPGKRNVGNQGG